MKKTVTIIDYGLGNLFSVARAFEYLGADVVLTEDIARIKQADYLLLPGVGAFNKGMLQLKSKGLDDAVKEFSQLKRPLLGICLGMQMLFDLGEENGQSPGLGLIAGKVVKIDQFDKDGQVLEIPHIGWSKIIKNHDSKLLSKLPEENAFYFVHSYHGMCGNPKNLAAYSYYGGNKITAVVEQDNIFGCQFHPEKSAEAGLAICNNFLQI